MVIISFTDTLQLIRYTAGGVNERQA